MHTFFINTSNSVKTARHERLFDSLVGQNKIMVFDYPLDDLQACADKISELITRNCGVSEVYNIIVYVETSGRNETALAEETVAALHVEETLFAQLYTLGRKPKEALVLFGENFDRDAEYSRGDTYRKNINQALWDRFPLPTEAKTREILKKIQKEFGKDIRARREEFKNAVQTALASAAEDKLLHTDNEFVMATVLQMAESISAREPDTVDLLKELCLAVNTQRTDGHQSVTTQGIRYAFLRLADSDFNARNQTEYRILLFVYLCAALEKIELGEMVAETEEDCGSCASLRVYRIPQVQWSVLSKLLQDKKQTLVRELELIEQTGDPFPAFDESLLKDGALQKAATEKPKLTVQVNSHPGLSVAQLRSAVKETYEELRKKNAENETTVRNYITRATDDFSAAKDTTMSQIQYKSSSKTIQNDQLTEEFIARQLDQADARIAANERLSMASGRIDSTLKQADKKINYYFDCLEKGKWVYIIGILFVLAFAIPYGLIQYTLFQVVHGWIFFAASLAIFILAYTFGYLLFQFVYKRKVVKVLQDLGTQFGNLQKNKQNCLDNYEKMLTRDIPLSFCLSLYQQEFKEYMRRKKALPEYITYHTRQLSQLLQYINNLLEELDIASLANPAEVPEEYKSIIMLEQDKSRNGVYALVDEKTITDVMANQQKGGR